MDSTEARELLRTYLATFERMPYDQLCSKVDRDLGSKKVQGASGIEYQMTIDVFWDHRPGGAVRIIGAIDDGGLSAFLPLSEDLLREPDTLRAS
jgi:hypothetical protein